MGSGTPVREWQWNQYHIKQYEQGGVTVRVLEDAQFTTSTAQIGSVFDEVAEGNAWIKDPSMQVTQVLITVTNGVNEFRTYGGKPVVILDYKSVESSMVRHEMGHAIFDYYRLSKSAPENAALQIATLFTKIQATKPVKQNVAERGHGKQDKSWPAGIWIVDPSQWTSGRFSEHPNDDSDEFFASAREAFITSSAGLKKAINKFGKYDPDVRAAAKKLNDLLGELKQAKAPSAKLDKAEIASGQRALSTVAATLAHEIEVEPDVRLGAGILQMVADPVNSKAKPVGGTSIKTTIPAVQPRRTPLLRSQPKSAGVFGTLFGAIKQFLEGDEYADTPAVNRRVRPPITQPRVPVERLRAHQLIAQPFRAQLETDRQRFQQDQLRQQQQRLQQDQ